MNRVIKTTINGTEYVLNFSVNAAEAMIQRYGTLEKIQDALVTSKENKREITDIIKEVAWMIELLSREGAKYHYLVDGTEYHEISEETVMLMPLMDVLELRAPVLNAIAAGMMPTVEVKPDKKNEETETEK